jgi:hypothetical protein
MPPFTPYKSSAQQRFFHTDTAAAKGISPEDVAGKDAISKGRKLPKKLGKAAPVQRALMSGGR